MKKRKNLAKKIQRLKARLEKDAKKLARLTQKMVAALTPAARIRPRRAKKRTKRPSTAVKPKAITRPIPSSPAAKKRSLAPRAKKKRSISPERRAQLSAAMKARWQAKRATAAAGAGAP